MKFSQPHLLSQDDAKRRIETLLDRWRERYGVSVTWSGDAAQVKGHVKGFAFDASLAVRERAVDAEGSDPGFLLRAAATAYLKRKLGELLDPSKTADEVAREV